MNGQVAFEYIIIVGLVILFLIPLWSYIADLEGQASSELSISYAQNAVDKIASHADLVYSQGPPAKITSRVYIPTGVTQARILNSTIVLTVRVGASVSDVMAVSIANMTGSVPSAEGNYQLIVEAVGNLVNVTVV